MKTFGFILLFLFARSLWGQTDTLVINKHRFLMIKTTQFKLDYTDTIVKFYRLDSLNKKEYLLTHTIYQKSADCNNIFEDIGSYQVSNDKIIFITDYLQNRNDPIPSKRKQIYQVKANGQVIEIYDKQLVPWESGWVNTNE